jgi:hypothetical protein
MEKAIPSANETGQVVKQTNIVEQSIPNGTREWLVLA